MNWNDVGIGLISGAVGGILVSLVDSYLATRREKRAESREQGRKVREASAAVVDLLSEWVRPTYVRDDGKATNEDLWTMQRECWRTLIWLDERLVKLLVSRLANSPDAVDTGQIVIQARKILLGLHKTELASVNHWPPKRRANAQATGPNPAFTPQDPGTQQKAECPPFAE
jgi:hypothetical protein